MKITTAEREANAKKFHALWGDRVGQQNYDKKEWIALQKELEQSQII